MPHSLPELFAMLKKVNGDYDAAVRVTYVPTRVWDDSDSSRLDYKNMIYYVSIKLFGCNDQEVSANAKTLEEALAHLAEEMVKAKEKLHQYYSGRFQYASEELNKFNNPPRICGADASIPFEHATLGTKCTNTMPCPRHGMMGGGPYR